MVLASQKMNARAGMEPHRENALKAMVFAVFVNEAVVKMFLFSYSFFIFLYISFLVTLECGGMRKENCTYFESTASFEGPCMATVCKMNDDIAQLR